MAEQSDAVAAAELTATTTSVAQQTSSAVLSVPASADQPDVAAETTAPSSTVPAEDSTTSEPATTTTAAATTSVSTVAAEPGTAETVTIRFESQVADVSAEQLAEEALTILNDPRGWVQAGFTFVAAEDAPYRVVLAEGPEVDALCLPLMTYSRVSCQNGPVVALNADRWRSAVPHWVLGVEVYRGYLVNHEVGHLIGQRHPKPRCPVAGRPAGVMEQQTAGLEGCIGNPWPRDWEISYASQRPVVYAPLPDWGPDPVPTNSES